MAKRPMSEAAEEARETPAMKRREGKTDNEKVELADIHKVYGAKPKAGKGKRRGC